MRRRSFHRWTIDKTASGTRKTWPVKRTLDLGERPGRKSRGGVLDLNELFAAAETLAPPVMFRSVRVLMPSKNEKPVLPRRFPSRGEAQFI